MAHQDQLMNYFGATMTHGEAIGAEVETFFGTADGSAISIEQSQAMLRQLVSRGWSVEAQKGSLITVVHKEGNRVQYELGYPNLELSVRPHGRREIVRSTRSLLDELYEAGESCGAFPLFTPIYGTEGNFLALPDDRDATWLSLDGKDALSPLARISAVQFTINVFVEEAIHIVNRLLAKRDDFLASYPQDAIWRRYVSSSAADYREDRYGGPKGFECLWEYCRELANHAIVSGDRLVPFDEGDLCSNASIELFLRSVWWYFRLRRYGHNLCVEVRPIARQSDEMLEGQLDQVLQAIG